MSIRRALLFSGAALLGIGTLLLAWIWIAPCFLGGCAPLDDLARYHAEGSELLDHEGDPFAHLATVNRRVVPLDSLPEHLPQAVIAIEDQRFRRHHGIDFRRTLGALLVNVRAGEVNEGGSTITQQLARNLFPEALPYRERSLRRKLLEARVARQIERAFSKDKILELYLNHVYLGSGAYGIETAARTYFGKSATELDLAEAATLAGLPQAPSQINPKENVERARERRDLVLDRMREIGFIDGATAEQAKQEPIRLAEGDQGGGGRSAAYFIERVRRELEATIGSRFYTDGLKVYTTLDRRAQAAAEEELARQLEAIESGRFGPYRHPRYGEDGDEPNGYLQGAVIVMDVRTGEVRALVGGRDFSDSAFDRATQALRQPGSAFKPFVYAAALERFRTPAHRVEDAPLRLSLTSGQIWEPRNYTGQYDGEITLREALSRSKNTATVRLAQEVGLGAIIRTAHDLGLSTEIPSLPSTILGAAEVRPIELVAAYAPFANGGERVEPHLIRKVVDREGRVIWEAGPRRERVLDPAIAFVLTTILQDAVDQGTGMAVRAAGFRGAAAGKTGTTNQASDAWFVGYTPELVAGIWIGLDEPETIVRGASGGTLAAPAWGRMMQRIYQGNREPGSWREPPGVTAIEVDRLTGAAVNEWCPRQGPTYMEYFIRTSPPRQPCPRYEVGPRYRWEQDSLWIDEEWSDLEDGYPIRELPPGIDWPELERWRRDSAPDDWMEPLPSDQDRRPLEAIGDGEIPGLESDATPAAPLLGEPAPAPGSEGAGPRGSGQPPPREVVPSPPEVPPATSRNRAREPEPSEGAAPRLLGVPAQRGR